MKRRSEPQDTRRRFEQWAKNPRCEANTLSAVHGISMAEVAESEGLKPSMGQSPFAIARAQTFERRLLNRRGQELLSGLLKADVPVQGGDFSLVDLRVTGQPSKAANLAEARRDTERLLRALATGISSSRPNLIASAVIEPALETIGRSSFLVIDLLAVEYSQDGVQLTVGLIKTFPDRGGYTDRAALAAARAQAGVYVHLLRRAVNQMGIAESLRVSSHGFVVLPKAGTGRPSIRGGEDLTYQAWRAERGLTALQQLGSEMPTAEPASADPGSRLEVVRQARTDYHESCVTFCDRADRCQAVARESGNAAYLGEGVEQLLGTVPLHRAVALLEGATPSTPEEHALAFRFAIIQ